AAAGRRVPRARCVSQWVCYSRTVFVDAPQHTPGGGPGPAAAKVRGFTQELARRIAPVPVRLVDERMTTVSASQGLRASGVKSKKGRSVIDQAAAVIILQQALESERVSGNPPGEGVEVVI
ncbi:Holliday junction resolvase RuvX, partial [Streptomyces sp. NPDC127091]|uniref:Holliday junction resolvase RuvX n=1 Tax=Streptomyces sp. NPDC127091 TaxID=3347134 RepID=UPI0036500FB3